MAVPGRRKARGRPGACGAPVKLGCGQQHREHSPCRATPVRWIGQRSLTPPARSRGRHRMRRRQRSTTPASVVLRQPRDAEAVRHRRCCRMSLLTTTSAVRIKVFAMGSPEHADTEAPSPSVSPSSPAGSPTGCVRPGPTKEDARRRAEQPQGVGTFSWPPAGTSTWPLTPGVGRALEHDATGLSARER